MLGVFRVHQALILLDQRFLGIERGVHRELPVVEKERLVFIFCHPGHGLIAHPILDMLGRRALLEIRKFPGGDKTTCGARAGSVWQVNVKALLQRRVGLRA